MALWLAPSELWEPRVTSLRPCFRLPPTYSRWLARQAEPTRTRSTGGTLGTYSGPQQSGFTARPPPRRGAPFVLPPSSVRERRRAVAGTQVIACQDGHGCLWCRHIRRERRPESLEEQLASGSNVPPGRCSCVRALARRNARSLQDRRNLQRSSSSRSWESPRSDRWPKTRDLRLVAHSGAARERLPPAEYTNGTVRPPL